MDEIKITCSCGKPNCKAYLLVDFAIVKNGEKFFSLDIIDTDNRICLADIYLTKNDLKNLQNKISDLLEENHE